MDNYENIKPYADFAHTAAQHGGVDSYLNEIAEENYNMGVLDEKQTEGMKALVLLGVGLSVWEGGKWVFRKVQGIFKKKRKDSEQKSEAAKNAIKRGVQEAKEAGLVNEPEDEDGDCK